MKAKKELICGCGEMKRPMDDLCQECQYKEAAISFLNTKDIGPPPFDPVEEPIREGLKGVEEERERLLSIEIGLKKILEGITRRKILNGGFLSRIHWRYNGRSTLIPAYEQENIEKFKEELEDLFVTWDHSNIVLIPRREVDLYYFDGELEIRFQKIDTILPFIKDYKLVVDFSSILGQKKDTQEELDRINKIIGDVGIEEKEEEC